jgi:hypothetical protein
MKTLTPAQEKLVAIYLRLLLRSVDADKKAAAKGRVN